MNNSDRSEVAEERERIRESDREPRGGPGGAEVCPPEPARSAGWVRPNMGQPIGWQTITNGAGI
jgi:hypothetical protein